VTVKFLWWEVGLMNDTLDVILVNRCNQSDEFRTVLPAKMCARVLLILMLAAAAVLAVGTGMGAADKVNITFEGRFGGTTEAVAVSGDYDYIGQGQDFVVLDISNPAAPSESGRLILPVL
jgi:hypothetical protein